MKTGFLSLLMLSLLAADAFAVARHDRPQVTALKKGGRTIGANLTLTVHPENYANVRVGLGKMKAAVPSSVSDRSTYKRELASGKRSGYLRLKLGHRSGMSNQPYEFKFKILYGRDLKAGDRVDVVSAFFNSQTYFHVYGMYDGPVNQGDSSSVVTLPR